MQILLLILKEESVNRDLISSAEEEIVVSGLFFIFMPLPDKLELLNL